MMPSWIILVGFTALLIKHYIFDFYYQPPYQWKNKGTYGHPGGILHAIQHALPTLIILVTLGADPIIATWLAGGELVAHYHIDWAKMNLNKHFGWGANSHEQFWQLLGLDQLLHHLTYAFILWYAFLS